LKLNRQLALYILLAVLMVVDIYSIFNTGNPNSLFRYVVKDPGWDFLITMILSMGIVVTVVIMNTTKTRTDDPVYFLLKENRHYIHTLREKGKSDYEIASSFIKELNAGPLTKKVAYRKALRYLKRI